MYEQLLETLETIKEKKGFAKVGIVLGSGLGELSDLIEQETRIKYEDLPHFPQTTVVGHGGELIFGVLNGVNVVLLSGRFHYYEGYSMKEVVYPVYLMKLLGVETIILSNACGGINLDFAPGQLMVIDDFINLMPDNPLRGKNDDRLGTRFPDMTEPYDKELQELTYEVADGLDINLKTGIYAGFSGPYYETRAEIQMIKGFGADAVGMSTVPETIAANHAGMKVLGISMITNMATGIQKKKHAHADVVRVAQASGKQFVQLILAMLPKL